MKLDEPAMEANTIRSIDPNIFIHEAEPCRSDGVVSGEARDNGDIDELLLERDEEDKASAS